MEQILPKGKQLHHFLLFRHFSNVKKKTGFLCKIIALLERPEHFSHLYIFMLIYFIRNSEYYIILHERSERSERSEVKRYQKQA